MRVNCERQVLAGGEGEADDWCLARLSAAQRAFVASWPETLQLEIDGLGETLFCHGSPRSDMETIGFPPGERLFVPALRGLTPKDEAVTFFESQRGA